MSQTRTFTPQFKAQVVLEMLSGSKSAAQISHEHHIDESVLTRWKQELLERAPLLFEPEEEQPEQVEQGSVNPAVVTSLERSLKEHEEVWAELAKH